MATLDVQSLIDLIIQITQHNNFDNYTDNQVIHIDPPTIDSVQGSLQNTPLLADYPFYQLNDIIGKILTQAGYQTPSILIEPPKMSGPDLTICIKDIFDLNMDCFQTIKDCSNQIYALLSSQEIIMIKSYYQVGIFINIICSDNYISLVLDQIYSQGSRYGMSDYLQDQSYLIEYSSPNMGKQMGIGHLRSTIIGQILTNIIGALGARTLRRNYLGDRGTPFGKLIYSLFYHYDIEGRRLIEDIITYPTETMLRLYASFSTIDHSDKLDQAKRYFTQLEQGYAPIVTLRKILRSATLLDFQHIYDQFEVGFDITHGESFTQQYLIEIEQDLIQAGYMTPSQGAMIVRFEKNIKNGQEYYIPLHVDDPINSSKEYEVTLIKKSDGATLYATRDLALMKYKASLGYKYLYNIVGAEQILHFKLISALAYALGYLSDECAFQHISFGMYLQDGQKMATRKGNIWRLSELIMMIANRIGAQFASKVIDADTNTKLAVASLIFQDIKNDRIKDINFDISAMTKLNGNTGIYLNYTLVRLQTLHAKLITTTKIDKLKEKDLTNFNQIEHRLIIRLSLFPLILIQSYHHLKPHLIAQYTLEIVSDINNRYSTSEKMVDIDPITQKSKALYIQALITGLSNLMHILHLPQVDRM